MKLKKYLPNWIKPILRFVWYKNERRKIFRESIIRKKQNLFIKEQYNPTCKSLIVFIVEGADWFTGKDIISGGILSIASIYEETQRLEKVHGCKTMMVTHDKAHLLLAHTQFPNKITVFRLNQLFRYFKNLDKLIIHIPELLVTSMEDQLKKYHTQLLKIPDLQINILNQSIHLMPDADQISLLRKYTPNITQTTAHERYTTREYRKKFGIPLHKLSVFGSPEKYTKVPFEQKENQIIISPDEHPQKERILKSLISALPDFTITMIQNMPYKTYLDHVSRAKFAVTFGEGMDFYFIETVFSGGIGIATYNTDFFTEEFQHLPGVFDDVDQMQTGIINFIIAHNSEKNFLTVNSQQFDAVSGVYKYHEYVQNITKFYQRDYTFA